MADPLPNFDWSLATWEGSRRAQHQAFARLTFREKMEALESACDLSQHFLAQRRQQDLPYIAPQTGAAVRPST